LATVATSKSGHEEYATARYIAPFLVFIAFLALAPLVRLDARWDAPVRVTVLAVVCYVCWPRELSLRPVRPLLSVLIGIVVFFIWIAPDFFIPGYRQNALFSNSVLGHLHSSLRPSELQSSWVLAWRTIRAVLIVPIVEELFWRAWLMRWLINPDFQRVRLGTYAPLAFWATAILFASEHGPYWDVGLITGIIYNAWMIRTRSVADCILMHAITNGVLSWYVIATAQWQYWQ
jgi:hypothetical protein